MSLPNSSWRQSRSLNDLCCKEDINGLHPTHPSSSQGSFDSNWYPARPLEPTLSPPARIKTPPGLPSFGTHEATLLRLERHRSSRTSSRLRSWGFQSEDSTEQAFFAASPDAASSPPRSPVYSPPLTPQLTPQHPPESDSRQPEPGDILRRTLAAIGMSRVLDPDPIQHATSSCPAGTSSSLPNSKLHLPPWIYMATSPGPLGRADDGSFMRGTFGPRFSGQGIGGRDIDSLPLARVSKPPPSPELPAPVTLTALRSTDVVSGRRNSSVSAIGPAEHDRGGFDEKGKLGNACDRCCDKCWVCLCCLPEVN